jgi:hypothetical protein
LIQETAFADSVIAHFGRSTAHWPTFATQSALNGHGAMSDLSPQYAAKPTLTNRWFTNLDL